MKNETNQADEWASVWLTAVVAIGAYWALVGVPACTENERQGVEQAKQKHKEKINTILELNTLSISLTHKQCQKFDRAPEIEQLIRKGVDEIVLKTNIAPFYYDVETREIKETPWRGDSYNQHEQSTFDKRNLAISFRMKGTATWQAFTQAQIKRIFTETGYGQYSLPKDGICVYSSQTTEWKSANIVGLPSPPSQELAGKLNDKQISLVPKTISK